MPLISTIIPAFNAAATLKSTLASAQSQSIRDIEILIIDDGSRDQTVPLARQLAAEDPRIKVFQQPNAGVAAARNRGLDVATGRYVHFLDADDLACEGAYDYLVKAEQEFDLGAAAGMFEVFSDSDGPLLQPDLPADILGLREVIAKNTLHGVSQLIRREAMGGLKFDTSYIGYEDQDLWIRLAEHGVRWRSSRRIVGRYRLTRGSLSKSALMLPCAEDVFIRAAKRTGALSDDELRIRLGDCSMAYATRAALLSDESVEPGARLMASARVRLPMIGSRAAAMGHSQSVFALGVWPQLSTRLTKDETLAARLERWWHTCANNNWMDRAEISKATTEFSQLCIPPQRIAQTILSVSSRDITLIGFGRNAKWLLKQPLDGRRIYIRDDRFTSGSNHDDVPPHVTIEDMSAPSPPGRTVIITPIEDELLTRKFPGAFRWKLVRDEIARLAISSDAAAAA